MSFRPEDRFDSVASFFLAFEAAVHGRAPSEQPASSLTQQFFAEGDRLEADAAKPAEPIDGGSDVSVSLGAFDHVPRRRAPLVAALSLGVVALAIVGWSIVRPMWGATPPRALDTDVLSHLPGAAAPSASAPVALAPSRTASGELRRVVAARHVRPRARPQTEPPPLAPAAQAAPPQAPPQPAASPPDEETDEEMAAADRAAERAEQPETTGKTTDESAESTEKIAPVPTEQPGQ
jgi:hypothetical protein